MKTAIIRQAFLDYFKGKGHSVVPSSSLVPKDDPTLLFTNAGMVQFKDVFLGQEQRDYTRATSSQRCVRAGGKHNDLDNVGYTARHHTFFEMLGNFSFGDYFKREAILFAWEFLTEVMKLPKEKLWVTVYDKDEEAATIWTNDIGLSQERVIRIATKDNFWEMGDTGPCGPCSEIFYDHGPEVFGGLPGTVDEDGDRYIEIWNIVFMQYNRGADGELNPLPKPSVDTGMGLERLAAILQGVHNNYDIDLFQALIRYAADLAHCRDLANPSLRVIADHIRSCSFLIVDGMVPSSESRGYVLRRIIRRAIRHGHKLGIQDAFFYKLVAPLVQQMGEAYPELLQQQAMIERILLQEEEQFAKTLEQGMRVFEQSIADLTSAEIPGETIFKLYDTYGFPVDLTADIARERNLSVDEAGFEVHMEAQRERARAASQFSLDYNELAQLETCSTFSGYDKTQDQVKVTDIILGRVSVEQITSGQEGVLVLDASPFYAESGGQVGDTGIIKAGGAEFLVTDTQKQQEAILHIGRVVKGEFFIGEEVQALVDDKQRQATALNHSATHLLHAALRKVLGEHVMQKGSLVDSGHLRFDFSHFEAINAVQLAEIEGLVNQQIRCNHPIETNIMAIEVAQAQGAMALFGEKYADDVRVLSMGDFSMELCGGIHTKRTGDIGLMKITSESGIAAGVRRIEAVTGEDALVYVTVHEQALQTLAEKFKGNRHTVVEKADQLLLKLRHLEKETERLKAQLVRSQGADLASLAVEVKGVKVLAAKVEGVEAKGLRDLVDQLKNKLGSAVIILAVVEDSRVHLIAGSTHDCKSKVPAGQLVNFVAEQVGGKGGGRPDMAQAGGREPEKLAQALESVTVWVAERL
ncbi:Alanine--tRNA ligase [Piscirickettsia salmonis]|uniref:Alanine--tRNA ligase n=1 Tax=Piscirickettsia salmonis TaxID=1238 RepID=A0A1L6TBB7_PISSA|nr:alanine--tRNA ligase [Piscirickettsia salmonis]AKP73757.1 alanine--tRNA ligase [Piscirickettsia salmonis LF-89 = ATCC VR-1361]ALB22548.1 alanyl-tRNA synthetase [Piscirickettsia salmonis]ALY02573.1 alanine--tRNA ligase [Piscirickettsia salmonis]AMA42115.1 alanine--tRNA ligase [Piscirickettsia salmonis]AOS34591.1 alanine--tRNA ligase [Piscirickettsia salmonis]